MGFKKRQLVLAALVVSLGAAVYLNWQFSGTPDIIATNASQSDKELGAAALVNASASSLTSKPISGSSVSSAVSRPSSNTGESKAASVVSSSSSAVSQTGSQISGDAISEYFNQTRLSRQKSRDEAIELLEKVMNDSTSTEEAKKKAVDDAAVIAQNMLQESNIENLIKSKGYEDSVVFLQNGECRVVVKKNTQFAESDAVAIRDIITGQTDVAPEHITIVEAK